MRPSRGLLLVRPVDTEELSAGGVILTQNYRDAHGAFQCEVIAVGEPAICDPTRSREERKCAREHAWQKCAECAKRFDIDCIKSTRVHPTSIQAGDWLVCRPRCFIDGPAPERKEWFMRQDDALAILRIVE